jgi:dihydrodipicolinate synthase/N-acetylneuraminate lyase
VGIKAAMALAGMIGGEVRLPLCPMTGANLAELEKALADYGVKTGR